MGRKSKVSYEEKLNAVEDYLNGIRSKGRISDALQVSVSTVGQCVGSVEGSH